MASLTSKVAIRTVSITSKAKQLDGLTEDGKTTDVKSQVAPFVRSRE